MSDKHTIFLVDDEAENIALYRRVLNAYSTRGFTDPRAALDAVPAADPECIVLDYRMPHMSGLEFARQCRTRGYEGALLLATAFPDLDELVFAEQVSLIYRIVPKPIQPDHFCDQIELVIADTRFRKRLAGRRRHPRVVAPVDLTIGAAGAEEKRVVKNISVSGVLLDPGDSGAPTAEFEVTLRKGETTLRSRARVVRSDDEGLGVEFLSPSAEFLDAVGSLITDHRFAREDRRRGPGGRKPR